MAAGLPPTTERDTHIIPIMVGDPEMCRQASQLLLDEHDIYIQPIRSSRPSRAAPNASTP